MNVTWTFWTGLPPTVTIPDTGCTAGPLCPQPINAATLKTQATQKRRSIMVPCHR
jgi:hypothetical protein